MALLKKNHPGFVTPFSSQKSKYSQDSNLKMDSSVAGHTSQQHAWSPLRLGRIEKVTPRTKRKIKERFTSGLGLHMKMATITSPGLPVPFNFSQSESHDVLYDASQQETAISENNKQVSDVCHENDDCLKVDCDQYAATPGKDNKLTEQFEHAFSQSLSSKVGQNKPISADQSGSTSNDPKVKDCTNVKMDRSNKKQSEATICNIGYNTPNYSNDLKNKQSRESSCATILKKDLFNKMKYSKSVQNKNVMRVNIAKENTVRKIKKDIMSRKRNIIKKLINESNIKKQNRKKLCKISNCNATKKAEDVHEMMQITAQYHVEERQTESIQHNQCAAISQRTHGKEIEKQDFCSPNTGYSQLPAQTETRQPRKTRLMVEMVKQEVLKAIFKMHLEIEELQEKRKQLKLSVEMRKNKASYLVSRRCPRSCHYSTTTMA